MLKIAVDFDETLNDWHKEHTVRNLVKILIKGGADVWILTARTETGELFNNTDLYLVMKELGLPKEKVIFTNLSFKDRFMDEHNFDILIDNCWKQIQAVNHNTKRLALGMLVGFNIYEILNEVNTKYKSEL